MSYQCSCCDPNCTTPISHGLHASQNYLNGYTWNNTTGSGLSGGNQLGYPFTQGRDLRERIIYISLANCQYLIDQFREGKESEKYLRLHCELALELKAIYNLEYLELMNDIDRIKQKAVN